MAFLSPETLSFFTFAVLYTTLRNAVLIGYWNIVKKAARFG